MILRAFGRILLYLGGIVAILQVPYVSAQNAQSHDERLTIKSAWKHRRDVIKSLVLKADVVEVRKGRNGRPAKQMGPLTDNPPKTDRLSDWKVEYYYNQGKTALSYSGQVPIDDDSEKTVQQTCRATFDGQLNASLLEQVGATSSGSIERKRTAGGYISQDGQLLAVNLWLQPQLMFSGVGWDVANMKTESGTVEVYGIQCRRIRIPRKSSSWTSILDADAKGGWLPMQWQTWLNGRLTMKLTVQYKTDKKAGSVVSGWTYAHYNKAGESELMRKGRVIHCEVNVKIDPSHFKIAFPVGTRIRQDIPGGRRYYLQKAEGMVPVVEPNKSVRGQNYL